MPQTKLSKDKIISKMQRYCAYQDRCHREVRTKLLSMEVYGMLLEEIMTDLIKEDFLNEERFAKSFTRGKFKMKKWGRVKIEVELKSRNISEYCIRKGMLEIEEGEYILQLKDLIEERLEKHKTLPFLEKKHKAYSFCVNKGYEVDFVLAHLPK